MPRVVKECKSYQVSCDRCGAEVIVTVTYSPPFKDILPSCPFCGAVTDA